MATVFVPWLCLCFGLLLTAAYVVSGLIHGTWDGWIPLVVWAIAFAVLWSASLVVAAIACKRKLILDGLTLRLMDKKEVVYECSIREIASVERERFSPILNSNPGSVVITNYAHPLPDRGVIFASWFAYRRIKKYIGC